MKGSTCTSRSVSANSHHTWPVTLWRQRFRENSSWRHPVWIKFCPFLFFRMMLRACTARSRSIGQVHPIKHSKSQNKKEGLRKNKSHFRSIYWADGYVLVFSITDHNSYRTIQPLYQHVRRIHPSGNIPVILVCVCMTTRKTLTIQTAYLPLKPLLTAHR